MKICIGPVTLIERIDLSSIIQGNPGIGGGEHYFLLLAHKLSKLSSGISVTVLCNGPTPVSPNPSYTNLSFKSLAESRSLDDWDIGIFPTGFLAKEAKLLALPSRVIAVSHHPHDGHLRQLSGNRAPFAVVNLGRYQHLSNSRSHVTHLRIPSFFLEGYDSERDSAVPSQNLVGHISSLHPSKGFHVIAKQWSKVIRQMDGARLEILGGLSLYGKTETHPVLPTSQLYGDRLTRILGKDLSNGTVTFLGRVPGPIDDIVRRWSVVVINPNGIGEADPATLRDLIRLGVPVVTSRKYGLSEYMDYFPETTVKNARSIPGTIKRLLESRELQLGLSARNKNLAKALIKRNDVIENAWAELLFLEKAELITRNDLHLKSLQPAAPLLTERIVIFRNDLYARLFRFLERAYSIAKGLLAS